jgi:hypothetical protein
MTTVLAKNPKNQPLIDALLDLVQAESTDDDRVAGFKARAILSAARNLAKLENQIHDGNSLSYGKEKVPGVGKGIAFYIDDFLHTGKISQVAKLQNKAKATPSVTPQKMGGNDDYILINRAPILTLWVMVVAERQGFNHREALSYAKYVTSLLARSKGISLGIFEQSEQPKAKRQRTMTERVQVFQHVSIPVVIDENGDRLAVGYNNEIIDPDAVELYLHGAFKSKLSEVREAMRYLAISMTPEELRKKAYTLYEEFRPEWHGWAQKGKLDLHKIRDLAN